MQGQPVLAKMKQRTKRAKEHVKDETAKGAPVMVLQGQDQSPGPEP